MKTYRCTRVKFEKTTVAIWYSIRSTVPCTRVFCVPCFSYDISCFSEGCKSRLCSRVVLAVPALYSNYVSVRIFFTAMRNFANADRVQSFSYKLFLLNTVQTRLNNSPAHHNHFVCSMCVCVFVCVGILFASARCVGGSIFMTMYISMYSRIVINIHSL
jgi:hypothetical protein